MKRSQVAIAAGIWLFLSVGLWLAGTRPAVAVLAGIVAVVAVGLVVLGELVDETIPIAWTRPPTGVDPGRRTERSLTPLRNQLDLGRRYRSPDLHLTLVELVDDRLAAHHRIDRAADPAAAEAVLPPALARLVTEAPRPVTSARELRRILSDIEAL